MARVDRRTGQERNLGSVTVLRDSLTPATYVTAELPSGHVAHSLLTNANQDGSVLSTALDGDFPQAFMTYLQDVHWMPEISVAEFRKLISDRESRESSAKRIGSELELRYPFGAGHRSGIAEARLTISAEDYSPLQLILVPAGRTDEFRFVRTSYSPEPRTEEIARLFPPIDNQPQPSVTTLPKLAKAVPLSHHNSQAGESELAAASALHTLDACLGEELNIFPMSNGTVLVQGLVETSARRNAIRKALSAINLPLRVEIFLPQELKNGAELLSPPDRLAAAVPGQRGTMAATVADLSAQRIPLYEQLSRHFSEAGSNPHDTEQQIADFSNQVVTQARQTFLHAWALKKLDSEFSAERVIRLSPAAIAQVEGMRRDHRRWIAELSRREREMLEGVGSYVAEPMQLPTSAEQPSTVLLRLAREQDDLVRSLFTHSQYAQDPEAGLARLRSLLRQIGG
ncbi:MAG: hypothetical protein DMG68_13210 [Acidobacteria bacterium]|nr:MAG: hypothetical protein DMG68_13210 [Acidobacteriota bacterium]